MDRDELLRLCDAGLCEFGRELARRAPKGEVKESEGLLLYSGGHPSFVIVNGAIRTDSALVADEVLARSEAFFRARGFGFSLCVREHGDADLEAAARDAGYTLGIELPQMILERRLEERLLPEGVEIRRVTDAAGVRDFASVDEEAFEDEPALKGMVRTVYAKPRSLYAPHIATYVAYLEKAPASAAMSLVSHGVAEIGWVGTREFARKRGLGEAVTRAVTNAGFDMGARFASLQASPMGLPLYRKMGYREISKYRMFAPPGSR